MPDATQILGVSLTFLLEVSLWKSAVRAVEPVVVRGVLYYVSRVTSGTLFELATLTLSATLYVPS